VIKGVCCCMSIRSSDQRQRETEGISARRRVALMRNSEIGERTESAMMVKQLLSGSVYGWVFRQRKKSCDAKRRTEQKR
jgi:hypothetical protein